jgi:hypothetical protein
MTFEEQRMNELAILVAALFSVATSSAPAFAANAEAAARTLFSDVNVLDGKGHKRAMNSWSAWNFPANSACRARTPIRST